MKYIIVCCFALLSFLSPLRAQQPKAIPDRFLHYLNTWQTDSLRGMITGDFELKRNFTGLHNDHASFFDSYLPSAKACHGKFLPVKILSKGNPRQYLVNDESDYLRYLHIKPIQWKLTIAWDANNKVTGMQLDSLSGYTRYRNESKQKLQAFGKWLKTNFPDETNETRQQTEGLLLKRLKAYAGEK